MTIPVVGAGAALAAAIASAPAPVTVLADDDLRAPGLDLDARVAGAATVALGATGWSHVADALRRDHPGLVVLDPLPVALAAALERVRIVGP